MNFKTTHNLEFEISDSKKYPGWINFRVGTCAGLYNSDKNNYNILSVINTQIGNGHFDDVLEWFENSCKRDNKNLRILEVWNEGFKNHLIKRKGFREVGKDNVEKVFNTTVKRNDLCSCGSGKKFKKCCAVYQKLPPIGITKKDIEQHLQSMVSKSKPAEKMVSEFITMNPQLEPKLQKLMQGFITDKKQWNNQI